RLLPEARELLPPGRREGTRADLFAGVEALLRAACARGPLLLCLDDLQWADPDTRALFEHVARAARSMPLMLLGTAREEREVAPLRSALRRDGPLVEVTLAPLPEEKVQALLRGLSGNEGVAASLAGDVFAETEGNPLHVGELWRAMQHEGRLEPDA